jgi:clan AA aspartic protease
MGIVTSRILLRNARAPSVELEIDAVADTGSLHLCIPQHVCDQLQLEKLTDKEVLLADGTRKIAAYVGPLEIRFKNRAGFGGAIVMGDQVLLGAIPMEDLDLVVIPKTRELDVNPRSPDIGRTIATTAAPTAPAVREPRGRYVLPRSSPGRRVSPSAGSPSARSPARSRASPLP